MKRGYKLNKLERELLKTARKVVTNFFTEELQKQKNELEKKKDEKFYIDVLNSGIMIDINKLKMHGINNLIRQLKARSLDQGPGKQ